MSSRNEVINALLLSIKKLISRRVINNLLLLWFLFEFYSFLRLVLRALTFIVMFARLCKEQKLNSLKVTDVVIVF